MSPTDQAWQYLQQFTPGQYVQWHLKRMVTSIDYLASQVDLKGLKVLDLGHDPLMGLLMVRTGMTLTGNLAPGSKDLCRFSAGDGRAIEWASDEFDFEGPFPYPDHSFDLVTGFEIIEHVRDNPRAVLREIKRVLKPGGLAYLGTPNVNSWSKLMRQFRGDRLYDSMPYSNEYGPRHFMCHVYEYSPYELKQFLRSEGFALVHARTWDVYPRRREAPPQVDHPAADGPEPCADGLFQRGGPALQRSRPPDGDDLPRAAVEAGTGKDIFDFRFDDHGEREDIFDFRFSI